MKETSCDYCKKKSAIMRINLVIMEATPRGVQLNGASDLCIKCFMRLQAAISPIIALTDNGKR